MGFKYQIKYHNLLMYTNIYFRLFQIILLFYKLKHNYLRLKKKMDDLNQIIN